MEALSEIKLIAMIHLAHAHGVWTDEATGTEIAVELCGTAVFVTILTPDLTSDHRSALHVDGFSYVAGSKIRSGSRYGWSETEWRSPFKP